MKKITGTMKRSEILSILADQFISANDQCTLEVNNSTDSDYVTYYSHQADAMKVAASALGFPTQEFNDMVAFQLSRQDGGVGQ